MRRNQKTLLLLSLLAATSVQSVKAGGYLTNTNQSIAFLRCPSRDAIIALDGVYSNPAGTAFLSNGFRIQFNAQNVHQHRYIDSSFSPFAYGQNNDGASTKHFKGSAKVPLLPSLHVAYNWNDKWSINGSFMVIGGGGKCTFDEGLGSFEAAASLLPVSGQQAGLDINSYSINSFMRGNQYYFGGQIGAAYRINEHLSVSLQGRMIFAQASYYGYIKDISVYTDSYPQGILANTYFNGLHDQCIAGAAQCEAAAQQYTAYGMTDKAAQYTTMAQQYTAKAASLSAYATATEDVELNCDENGVGFTPIIGIDYKLNDKFNFAAKYEFKTRMRLKNRSANSASADKLSQLNQFKDGTKIAEDIPAYFTVGAEYKPIPTVALRAGWHFYDDKNATKYNDTQKLLRHNTHEWNAGAEWNCYKAWTVSAGWQNTCYGNSDDYMKDISFNTSSNTYGFGFNYKLNEHWDFDLGYFFTKYNKYTKETANYNGTGLTGKDVYWRDNYVLGLGVTFKL